MFNFSGVISCGKRLVLLPTEWFPDRPRTTLSSDNPTRSSLPLLNQFSQDPRYCGFPLSFAQLLLLKRSEAAIYKPEGGYELMFRRLRQAAD